MISLSEKGVSNLLVGRKVEISVGEPWDFESPDGRNVLNGRITAVGQDDPNDHASQWLEVEVTPFEAEGGRSVDHLKAKGRYVLPTGIIDQMAVGESATVHLGYGDQVRKEDLPDGTSPFLIGGVSLAG